MIINRRDKIPTLKEIFSKIFSKNDPFDKMFVPSISSKIILYPTKGYHLSEKQFLALIRTMETFGEKSFYLSEIEGNTFVKNDTGVIYPYEHLELNIETPYIEYEGKTIILENALYSSEGTWGIIISHEEHAVLGGHKDFMETFEKLYPEHMDDQKKFVEAIKYWGKLSKADLSWLPAFIAYINE